jgi:hypothetical protein
MSIDTGDLPVRNEETNRTGVLHFDFSSTRGIRYT